MRKDKIKLWTYLLAILALVLLAIFSNELAYKRNIHLHAFNEAAATILSLLVGILALIRYYARTDIPFLFLGVGFLGTSFLNFSHLLYAINSFPIVSPLMKVTMMPWIEFMSHTYLAMFMIGSWHYSKKRLKEKHLPNLKWVYFFAILLLISSLVFPFFIKANQVFRMGTSIYQLQFLLPAFLFAIAAIGYYRKMDWKKHQMEHWILIALIISCLSVAFFSTQSPNQSNIHYELAYKAKLISYSIILAGILINIYRLFVLTEKQNKELESLIQQKDMAQDELERKTLQLIQTEKISALGTMVAGVAHELYNPMMGMLTFTKYCKKHVPQDNISYEILDDLLQEINRCIEIVDNLLKFSRMESSGDGKMIETDLEELINKVTTLLKYQIEKNEVNLSLDMPKKKMKLFIKPNHLQQVLFNLIKNAIDAMQHASKKNLKLILSHGEVHSIVSIADSGSGIPSEVMQNIFDPFFTTKEVGKGTGLGLSICKSIIEEHGGKIDIVTQEDVGTSFLIFLPNENINQSLN